MDLVSSLRELVKNKEWLRALELVAEHPDYYRSAIEDFPGVVKGLIHNALAAGADPVTVASLAAKLGITAEDIRGDLSRAIMRLAIKEPGKALNECKLLGIADTPGCRVAGDLSDELVYRLVIGRDYKALESFTNKQWGELRDLINQGVVEADYSALRRAAMEMLFKDTMDNDINKVPDAVRELIDRGYSEARILEEFIEQPSESRLQGMLRSFPVLGKIVALYVAKEMIDSGRYGEAARILRGIGLRPETRKITDKDVERLVDYLANTVAAMVITAIRNGRIEYAESLVSRYAPYLSNVMINVNGREMSLYSYLGKLLEIARAYPELSKIKDIHDAIKFYTYVLNNYDVFKELIPGLPPREALEELLNIYNMYTSAQRLFNEGHIRAAVEELREATDAAKSLAERYPDLAPPLLSIILPSISIDDIECVLGKAGLWPPSRGLSPRLRHALGVGGLAAM